ncbi:MAG: DoxX family protein [Acidobacteria bacterium]|nr:DoxX family protein [Acidobacteriota bacterium]
MEYVVIVLQIVIALGIINVWILRPGKSTCWRGGEAKSMREEFAVYGLPAWFMYLIGFLKCLLAVLLILGIWIPVLTMPAAAAMALLMLGAVSMHVRVKDPLKKALPSFTMMVLSLAVAIL